MNFIVKKLEFKVAEKLKKRTGLFEPGSGRPSVTPVDPLRVSSPPTPILPSRQIYYEISIAILALLMAMNLNGPQIPADVVRRSIRARSAFKKERDMTFLRGGQAIVDIQISYHRDIQRCNERD